MKKYLITGESGFIGKHLLGLLKNYQAEIRVIARKKNHKYETFVCNLGSEKIPYAALDSIDTLATPHQKKLPFYLSYAAFLESELGNYEKALVKANELKRIINNDKAPAIYYTFAQLYLDMDSLNLAKTNIEKAINLDAKHQLAFRVKKRIDDKLKEKHIDTLN